MAGRRMERVLGLAAVFAVATTSAADFRPLPGHEYREYYDPPTPVSGIAVVGAMLLTGEGPSTTEDLWVYFKEPFDGQLDLEVVSADGRFLGRGAFVGSSGRDQWVQLSLAPSGTAKRRPSDPAHEKIAVSAQTGSRNTVMVAAWGTRPGDVRQQKVRLFVNSRRAQMGLRVNPDPKVPLIQCERLAMTNSVRFDTVCTFSAAELPPDGKITLVRRDGLQTDSQTVTLEL